MAVIDELKVIDGYIQDDKFIMRGIGKHTVYGKYKAEGLRSLARIIHDSEPFNFTIDKDNKIFVPVELNKQIKKELNMIANELEEGSQ